MLEMLAIFAVLLAVWGLYGQRRAAAEEAPVAPAASADVASTHERGSAARRHLGTL